MKKDISFSEMIAWMLVIVLFCYSFIITILYIQEYNNNPLNNEFIKSLIELIR